MKVITVDNVDYYLGTELIETLRSYRSARGLIVGRNISKQHYIIAKKVNECWIRLKGVTVDDTNKSNKVLFCKNFIDTDANIQRNMGKTVHRPAEKAPDIFLLSDEDKIYNDEDVALEIEIRYKRETDEIFFRVEHISKTLGVENLHVSLLHAESSYEIDQDYTYFDCGGSPYAKIFLTFDGLLRCYYSAHNKLHRLKTWIRDVVIAKLGSLEKRQVTYSKILGVPIESALNTFNTCMVKIPAIYFFTLGFVRDLRHEMNISDTYDGNMIVCIYGRSANIVRRTDDHKKFYASLASVQLRLKYMAYITSEFLAEAEADIREYVANTKCQFLHKNETEMVIVDGQLLKDFGTQYEKLSQTYTERVNTHIDKRIKKCATDYTDIQMIHNEQIRKLENLLIDERRENKCMGKQYDCDEIVNLKALLDAERHKNMQLEREKEVYEFNQQLTNERHKNEILSMENQMIKQQCDFLKKNVFNT